ncbi:MAG: Virulence factor MviN [Acetothermia bacterium 64_32]|nr:MAG: Virulence factor MviN [Acetothermia bacterium 64_32]HAF70700.1 murein biosynthesis integral membrane protein MurJ [Candidatus Acetothermia bacterium]
MPPGPKGVFFRLRDLTRGLLGGGRFLGEVLRGAVGTGLARGVGLGREVALAHVFGASSAYDAFLIAYFVPHLLRRLLGEGGLAAAFLPVYVRADQRGEGGPLARATLSFLFLVLIPVCALGSLLAPWYVRLLAAGFPPDKLSLAVSLARWMFPFLFFCSLSALAGGMLNAHGRFFLPALSPAALSLGMILGALVLSRLFSPPILGLVVGVLLGGAGMVALQLPWAAPHLKGEGEARPEELKEIGRRLLPVLGGLAVAELNLLVDSRLASFLAEGSVAVLQYAMRLFQFPVGMLAVSVATAALPRLSREALRSPEGFSASLAKGVSLGAALLLPAMAGLLVLGGPTVTVLFQHGAFTQLDTLRTSAALCGYLSGLWAYGLVYLFSRAFYALGRPGIPVLSAAFAVGVNVGLDLWWVGRWGTFGLALATGLAGWTDALLQGWLLWRRVKGWLPVGAILRAAFSAGGMAILLWACDRALLAPMGAWAELAGGVPLGVLLYLGFGKLVGLDRKLRAAG